MKMGRPLIPQPQRRMIKGQTAIWTKAMGARIANGHIRTLLRRIRREGVIALRLHRDRASAVVRVLESLRERWIRFVAISINFEDPDNALQATGEDISLRNVAFMHFCYGIYASPCPATFVRKKASIGSSSPQAQSPSPEREMSHQPDDSIDIMITSEKRPGSSGVVHIGKMEVGTSECIQVAVKLAFSEDEKEVLEHEHRIYTHLHAKGVKGIPQNIGLFVDDELVDDGEGPYALIMTFAGDTILHHGSNIAPAVK
jgi:hypothetical protein